MFPVIISSMTIILTLRPLFLMGKWNIKMKHRSVTITIVIGYIRLEETLVSLFLMSMLRLLYTMFMFNFNLSVSTRKN